MASTSRIPVRASPKPKMSVPLRLQPEQATRRPAGIGARRAAAKGEGQQQAGQDEPDGQGDVAAEDDGKEAGHGA